MKEKIRAFFDAKTTWVALAGLAGAFGEHYVGIVNAAGALVMAIL